MGTESVEAAVARMLGDYEKVRARATRISDGSIIWATAEDEIAANMIIRDLARFSERHGRRIVFNARGRIGVAKAAP